MAIVIAALILGLAGIIVQQRSDDCTTKNTYGVIPTRPQRERTICK